MYWAVWWSYQKDSLVLRTSEDLTGDHQGHHEADSAVESFYPSQWDRYPYQIENKMNQQKEDSLPNRTRQMYQPKRVGISLRFYAGNLEHSQEKTSHNRKQQQLSKQQQKDLGVNWIILHDHTKVGLLPNLKHSKVWETLWIQTGLLPYYMFFIYETTLSAR